MNPIVWMAPIVGDGKDHKFGFVDEIEESVRKAVHHGDHDTKVSMDRMPSMHRPSGKRFGTTMHGREKRFAQPCGLLVVPGRCIDDVAFGFPVVEDLHR